MTQKLAWSERRQVKKGAKKKKKWKRRRQRKREESSLQSLSFFLAFFTSRRSLLSEGLEQVRVRKQPTFRDATTGFPRNDVWQTSAEISFWWRDRPKGQCFWLAEKNSSTNQKHYPDTGSDASLVWNFCFRFSDVISRGNQWWVALPNVGGCFIKTERKSPFLCVSKRPILYGFVQCRLRALFICQNWSAGPLPDWVSLKMK